jgi:hypothetical protein
MEHGAWNIQQIENDTYKSRQRVAYIMYREAINLIYNGMHTTTPRPIHSIPNRLSTINRPEGITRIRKQQYLGLQIQSSRFFKRSVQIVNGWSLCGVHHWDLVRDALGYYLHIIFKGSVVGAGYEDCFSCFGEGEEESI